MNQPTKESFLHDVRDHKLTILRDDGLYRHIRLSKPGDNDMQFDLVTWPGYLAYSGDMGDFTFSRLPDMFGFFRSDGGRINPPYWSEKIQATDKGGGHEKFSEEKFNRAIMEYVVEWIRSHQHDTTPEQRRSLWDEVVDVVIRIDDGDCGYRKRAAAHDFCHSFAQHGLRNFEFQDFWETNVEEYTYHYIWCCHALVWGIQQYDEAKPALTTQEAA